MATDKTRLTELATAVGLVHDPAATWPDGLADLTIPGIADDVWKPAVLPSTEVGAPGRSLLLRALANGRAFRLEVLAGRAPERIEWLGGTRSVWTSDIPRDLTVDGVWFIQAKYDSTCVLNTSPGALVDDLLVDHGTGTRESWFAAVAPRELQRYYAAVRSGPGAGVDLPREVDDLDATARAALKSAMRGADPTPAERETYAELASVVSAETARRWQRALRGATPAQRTQALFRMLRIAGGPYWLLGVKGSAPVRLAVTDTRTWRTRFALRELAVTDAHAGQPQVDWRADIDDLSTGERHRVKGFCEIRWSHGKLQGHPECKVQVGTPLNRIPGYAEMGTHRVDEHPFDC